MKPYDHEKIEKKWQKYWQSNKLFQAKDQFKAGKGMKKFYSLIEFPYPSGEGLHVGHIRSNTAMDIISHKRRMEGYNVLYPIGWDAFGLPTENYAIKTGIQPAVVTKKNSDTFRRQLKSLGFSFDWSREVNTSDPKYYKWTQWIFLQLLRKGLAYKKKMSINWCPKDMIGLANEEVVNGCCERCGTPVEKREKEQWMLAITKYADRLDKDLDDVDYLERIKIQQRNWIGKSEGAEIDFRMTLTKNKPRFVIIHGYKGSAKTNFIPWMKSELEKRGHEVETPELPNSNSPSEAEQVAYVLENCHFDEHTVIVSHSLGAVVAMKVIMKLNKPVSGLVLVAVARAPEFSPDSKPRHYWKDFTWDFDYNRIKKLTSGRIAVLSDLKEKDRIPYLKYLSEQLEAKLIETESVEEHFCAKQEPQVLKSVTPSIQVFTTRPDTIFGVTYVLLSPEHPWLPELLPNIENKAEVSGYIAMSKKETDIIRTDMTREKTGVELKGIKAVNPANNEEIPIWIADYVLADYGTGAVMAVPAHDERDFSFAKKYNLPMRQTIVPCADDPKNPPRAGFEEVKRDTVVVHVKDKSTGKFALLDWHGSLEGITTAIMGGIEKGQTPEQAALAEIKEEASLEGVTIVKTARWITASRYCASHKNQNRCAHSWAFLAEIESLKNQGEIATNEQSLHTLVWVDERDIVDRLTPLHQKQMWHFLNSDEAVTSAGYLINSGKFNGKNSEEIKKEITEFTHGKWVTKYKLRDWVFSRQRYWGEPIPVVICKDCGIVPLPEKDLPLKLPKVKNYKPTATGESPLASISKWVNTKCPNCKGKARRETDTMPNWAGSSWYYLRYTDPENKRAFADPAKLKYWTPVDWYNGGMEHTTLHLLYSRFWHKFLFDQGFVPTKEPYLKRTSHGLILAKGGVKMSKSVGNVVNPDSIVKTVGADALRLYEMFMGPFAEHIAWDENGIVGTRRFIEKVWKLQEKVSGKALPFPTHIETLIHKTIRKVSEDIEEMKFNTAVSALMIAVNELEKEVVIAKKHYEFILQLLAPFAPHASEELWNIIGNKKSILNSSWPVFDENRVMESSVKIMVQVDGKVRASFETASDTSEESLKNTALNMHEIAKWVGNKNPKKVIVVKGRLVNIVL